jgi:drug/metabolite transporter (DMT)-like permease
LSGALIIVGWHGTRWNISRSIGDTLFLVASFLTAGYTVIIRKSKLDPVHVAGLVATGSLVVYAPLYFAIRGLHLAQVPVADLTIQVIFQGIVVTVISLVLYCRAVLILGASGGSAFGALVPALSAGLPYLSWANGRQHQVGRASFLYQLVCIWRAGGRCRE